MGGVAFLYKALSSLPPHPHPSSPKGFRLVERPRGRSSSPRQESGLKGALLEKFPPQRPPFQGSSAGRRYLARPISASAATRRWCGSEICCPYGAPQGTVYRARKSLGRYGARGGLQWWIRGQMSRLSWPPKTGEGIFRNRPAKPLVAAVLYGHWLNMGTSAMPSGMGGIIPLKMGPVSVPAASDALPLLWRTSPLQQAVVLECHDEQRDAHRR